MAQTYFNLERGYLINHYRFKPLRDGFLLTNDFGAWVYLSKEEFALLRHNKLEQNQSLLSLLKEKGFIVTEDNAEKLVDGFRKSLRYISRGTYHHVIFLDANTLNLENIDENIKKIPNFVLQTPSREIIVKFKGNILENFEIMKSFVNEFKENHNKKIMFEIETSLENFKAEFLDFLVDNKFDVWVPLKELVISDDMLNSIKELQRRHRINFYLDVSHEIIGEEQKLIDFFVDNNFKSFFVRKTDDLNKEEFLEFWKKIMNKVYEINKKAGRIVIQENYSQMLLRKITRIDDAFYPELNGLCSGAVISELGYNLNGDIFANEESIGIELFNIGNVNSDYSSVVLSEDSLALISTSINSDAALEINPYKPYIGNCPVCNYLESGNIIGKNPNERNIILTEMLDYLFERILFEEGFLRFV